jgi:hypothetical protein
MSWMIIYSDNYFSGLMIEHRSKRFSKKDINSIISSYKEYGFYGTFEQVRYSKNN